MDYLQMFLVGVFILSLPAALFLLQICFIMAWTLTPIAITLLVGAGAGLVAWLLEYRY